jgi:ATP-binding cassette subfamily B protein
VAIKRAGFSSYVSPELRWLLKQIQPYARLHLGAVASISIASMLALLNPLIIKFLIDGVLPNRQKELLLTTVCLMLVGTGCRTALTSLGQYLSFNAVQRTALTIRCELLAHLDMLSADYHEHTQAGTILFPFKEPVEDIARLGSDLIPSVLHVFLVTGCTLGTMFILSPRLTLVVLPLVPIFVLIRRRFRQAIVHGSDLVQIRLSAWSAFLEHVSSILSIQLLGREKRQEREGFRLLARTVHASTELFRYGIWFTLWTSLAVAAAMSVAIGYGGWSVISGGLSLGTLVAFYGFIAQLFEPLSGAAELYARTEKAFASIRQLHCVLNLRPAVANPSAGVDFPGQEWDVK